MEKMKEFLLFGIFFICFCFDVVATAGNIYITLINNDSIVVSGYGIIGNQFVYCNKTCSVEVLIEEEKINCTNYYTNYHYNYTTYYNYTMDCQYNIENLTSILRNFSYNNFSQNLKEMKSSLYNDLIYVIEKEQAKVRDSIVDKDALTKKISDYEKKISDLEANEKVLNITYSSLLEAKTKEVQMLTELTSLQRRQIENYYMFYVIFLFLFLLQFGLLDKLKAFLHGLSYSLKK